MSLRCFDLTEVRRDGLQACRVSCQGGSDHTARISSTSGSLTQMWSSCVHHDVGVWQIDYSFMTDLTVK